MDLTHLPVNELHAAVSARRAAPRAADEALLRDVQSRGVILPLLVAPRQAGGYSVIEGARRLRAARGAGLAELRCVRLSDDEAAQLGENYALVSELAQLTHGLRDIDTVDLALERHVGRTGEDPQEVIGQWRKLKKDPEADPEAARALRNVTAELGVGDSEAFLEQATKLLRLDEELLSPLREGAVDSAQALALARIKDPALRQQLLVRAERGELSAKAIARQAKEAREAEQGGAAGQGGTEEEGPSGIEDLENAIDERIRSLPRARQQEARKALRALRAVFVSD